MALTVVRSGAADQSNVYVAVSDIGRIMLTYSSFTDADPKRGGGIFALRLENGEKVRYTPPAGCGDRPRCSPAQSAAVSAFPAWRSRDRSMGTCAPIPPSMGQCCGISIRFDRTRQSTACRAVAARWMGPGPAIGGGMIFLNSGYHAAGGVPRERPAGILGRRQMNHKGQEPHTVEVAFVVPEVPSWALGF